MSTLDTAASAEAADMPAPSLTWGGELRALFALAWPLILAQMAQNALYLTDVYFMGQLGPRYLAAGFLASSFFAAFLLFGVGVVGAVAPLVAQALGSRDIKAIRRIVRAGLWTSLLLGALIVPVVWNARPIFALLGQTDDNGMLAEQFLHIAGWVIFPSLLIVVVRSFLAAHGSTRVILLITIAGVVVNALGNYALVLGNFGFPRLELRGSGITTLVTNIAMLALMILYMQTHRRFRRYHIFARVWRPDWARLRQVLAIGVPIGFMVLAEVGLFVSAAFLMGLLGNDEVAAHGIALQFGSLAFMVPLGLSQATTVRVGYAYGAGSRDGIAKAGWMSLWLTVGFMALTCLLFISAPHQLVALFLDPAVEANRTALQLAASYLVVCGIFQLVDGSQVTAGAALRGLSDTTWPLIIAIIGYWAVGMPVAWLCGFVLEGRGVGIWIGLACGLAATAVILVVRFALRERLGLLARPPA